MTAGWDVVIIGAGCWWIAGDRTAAAVAIISIAQHARPNCSGHTEFLRPQL